jgi:hypothetical protein
MDSFKSLTQRMMHSNLTLEQKTAIYQLVLPSVTEEVVSKMSNCLFFTTFASKLHSDPNRVGLMTQCGDLLTNWNLP